MFVRGRHTTEEYDQDETDNIRWHAGILKLASGSGRDDYFSTAPEYDTVIDRGAPGNVPRAPRISAWLAEDPNLTYLQTLIADLVWPARILALAAFAVTLHVVVIVARRAARAILGKVPEWRYRKLRSIGTLATSAAVFTLYFLVVGMILREFGVSLTAYLASASVLGLAIGFGSQGVVQDVVTGLTFIFSDLVDVGDLVEISGQTGIVRSITMRFVELQNALGASVFIPNRTISNVINYPRGYVRCIVDVTLRGDAEQRTAAEERALVLMRSAQEQFPGILMTEPSSEGRQTFSSGKEIVRIKFRIWPNRGQPIESSYVQEVVAEMKKIDSDYQPWMVPVTYEVEKRAMRVDPSFRWLRISPRRSSR